MNQPAPLLHIQRLRVAQLRKFEDFELHNLDAGLNIIAGPNGAGKSTLNTALRAAFLVRYSSNASAADLQPSGNSGAAPTVELDFALQGVPHKLVKTFLKKKRCDLHIGSQQRSEEAAEDYLAQALGFGFAPRGVKADFLGVPGLLWVEQGAHHERFSQSVGFAAQHLNKALHAQSSAVSSSNAGSLAATTGDRLIGQLDAELAQYLGKSGKPVGAYAQLIEQAEALRTQVHTQLQHIALYRSQVDELETLQQQAQQDNDQQLVVQWQQALEHAQAQRQQALAVQDAHTQTQLQLQHAQSQLEVLSQVLQQHQQRAQELQRRTLSVEQAQQAVHTAQQTHQQAQQSLSDTQQLQQQAHAHTRLAEQARQHQQLQQRLQDHERQSQQLQSAWVQAQQALEQLAQIAQTLPALRVEKSDLQQLRKLEEHLLRARLQHEALATQLQFTLPPAQQLPWHSGAEQGVWQGEGQQWLHGATTVDLPGGGQLTITPGGSDVAGAAQRLESAQLALQQALRDLGVETVSQAQAALEQRNDLQAQQQIAQRLLHSHAPQGAQALKLQLQQAAQRSQALQQELAALPASTAAVDWQQAQTALLSANTQLEHCQVQEVAARQHLALAQQHWQTASQELAVVQQQAQDPKQQARLAQAEREAALLHAQRNQLQSQIAQHAQALQTSNLRFAEQDIERLQRSLTAHHAQVQQRHVRMASLRAALEQAGAQGLEEVNALTQAELAHAERRTQEIAQRSQALQTVLQRLKDKRSAALRRLQAPLEAHMQHYLQLLLPGGKMELDAQLLPSRVVADATADAAAQRVTGHVAQMSYGTQEQLAIISRLAYADLLLKSGHPTLLILDDALVHSDVQRLAQMKRVLFDAATRHQVLLFTCRPQDWQDAGAVVRMLP